MNLSEYPLLKLEGFRQVDVESFSESVELPDRDIPQRFEIKTKEEFCGGYFICLDRKITKKDIFSICQRRDWGTLSKLLGDFFIVYFDSSERRVYVYTGQSSAFPSYFSISQKSLILSPDFGLVFNNLKLRTLDTGAALDFVFGHNIGERTSDTIVSEIKQLPPGNLLIIEEDLSYKIEGLIDFEGFYSQEFEAIESKKKFLDKLTHVIGQVINEQLMVLGDKGFAGELSSGLDSSLICYLLKKQAKDQVFCFSSITSVAEDIDPKEDIERFSEKHGLRTKYFDVTDLYPFSTSHDLLWTKKHFFPSDHAQEEMYQLFNKYRKERAHAIFTGFGGDELYRNRKILEIKKYLLQYEYFEYVKSFKHKDRAGYFLTKKGAEAFLSKNRFRNKDFYFSIIPTSATSVPLFYFSIIWKSKCWPFLPFNDPRVLELSLRIPTKNGKPVERNELLRQREDVFLPSQFREKVDAAPYVGQFVEKEKKLVLEILRNSRLQKKGWIEVADVIKDLEQGKTNKFTSDGNLLSTLHNILRIEYFIQNNEIQVKE